MAVRLRFVLSVRFDHPLTGPQEVCEAGVGKTQHKAGASHEIDEIIQKKQINRPYRANKISSPACSIVLAIDDFLELFDFFKYNVEGGWAVIEHHRRHRTIVCTQIPDSRLARHQA